MALQSSGTISLDDIRIELGLSQSNVSLGSMSNTAGFADPDSMSEFYGYLHLTSFISSDGINPYDFACAAGLNETYYHSGSGSPSIGDYVYSDSNGTTPLTASWYKFGSLISAQKMQVNSNGLIVDIESC